MILSVHLLAGAAIGSKVKNYWAILVLALLSHFILDALPHWEYTGLIPNVSGDYFMTVTVKALLDILLGVGVVGLFLRSSRLIRPALWGAFFALLPDGLIFAYVLAQVFFGWNLTFLTYPIAFHDQFHFPDKTDLLPWRVAVEIFAVALSLFFIWQARRAARQRQ
jgi:hypothetical protein